MRKKSLAIIMAALMAVSGTTIPSNLSTAKAATNNAFVNQLGYKPSDTKIAVFATNSAGKQFQVVNANGNTVYRGTLGSGQYNSGTRQTECKADFSAVKAEGTYKVVVDGIGETYNFKISEDIYNDAFNSLQKFFYLQRCGESISGTWGHGTCHQQKAKIYGTNNYIDVSGGWHDAGDYGRYIVATATTVADLLIAYEANPAAFTDNVGIPESGNGRADVLDEVKGQLVWMMKMQNKQNGGVYHKVTTAGFPGSISADQERDELIVCPISTTATGAFAGVMAMGYKQFKNIDPTLASQCLAAAKSAYNYLQSHGSQLFTNPGGISTGEYGDMYDRDERYFAAAALFNATGESTYHNQFKNYVNSKVDLGYGWADMGAYANHLYLTAKGTDAGTYNKIKSAIVQQSSELLSKAKSDPLGIANGSDYWWGSNMAVAHNATMLVDAYKLTNDSSYITYAKEHINYCFGKNGMNISYVTGFGSATPKNIHHRPSWVANRAITGALVGGPNDDLEDDVVRQRCANAAPAKCYVDDTGSYSTNEVDIYWNSSLITAMAYTNCPNYGAKPVEPTQEPTQEPTREPSKAPSKEPSKEPTQIPTEAPQDSSAVNVTINTTPGNNTIGQVYTITAKKTIDLSKLKIRCYFTKSDSAAMTLWCDNAAAQLNVAPYYQAFTSSLNKKIGKDSNGYYSEISFSEAFTLKPGEGSISVQTRLTNSDWSTISNFKQGSVVITYA